MDSDRVEDLRATLLEYDENEVLEALILNNVIDPATGLLCDWWLNLIDPSLVKAKSELAEQDLVLATLARILRNKK